MEAHRQVRLKPCSTAPAEVGFHPIVSSCRAGEIEASRRKHQVHPKRDVKPRLRVAGCGKPNKAMSIGTILLIVIILLLIGAIPTWPYSRGWGYFPSGALGLILLVLIILLLLGKI